MSISQNPCLTDNFQDSLFDQLNRKKQPKKTKS